MREWPVSRIHRWLLSAADVDEALQERLAACWLEVSNAGGAVGFPFPPVSLDEVAAATDLTPRLRTGRTGLHRLPSDGSALIGRTGRPAGPASYRPPQTFRPGCPATPGS